MAVRERRVGWLIGGWAGRLYVAALFLFAAYVKISQPIHFASDIQSYEIFPAEWTHIMAFLIPWIEAFMASLLVIGFWRREARYLLLFTVVVFTALKTFANLTGHGAGCGCFGDTWLAEASTGWNGVWLNLSMLFALAIEWIGDAKTRRSKVSLSCCCERPVAQPCCSETCDG